MRTGGGRGGHALAELVVALPILAVAGALAAGMVRTSSSVLLEGERRLQAGVEGSALLDSLRVLVGGAEDAGPREGTVELPGGAASWQWDGGGELVIHLRTPTEGGSGVSWHLRSVAPELPEEDLP